MMFELVTPWNRIVVQHPESRIVLHGLRYTEAAFDEELIEGFARLDPNPHPHLTDAISVNSSGSCDVID